MGFHRLLKAVSMGFGNTRGQKKVRGQKVRRDRKKVRATLVTMKWLSADR